ncbi:MAG: hypothetical protein DDT22_01275 [candidate division WS2 bacterium]|nr:hypothetical protein [Candidatus Lithacetigena glycinireducens]
MPAYNVYYFSHDSNARNDEKILMLRSKHGWEGYGLFWALIEMMFEAKETCLSHNKVEGIAMSFNIDITLLQSVINTAITEGLFESNKDKFWSNSLRERKSRFYELREKRSQAGKKGMETRWKKPIDNTELDNIVITDDNKCYNNAITNDKQCYNGVITKNNKGKEIKGKESKVNKSKVNENKKIEDASIFSEIISDLNEKTGKTYKTTDSTKSLIRARLSEGFALEDFQKVHTNMAGKWKGDPEMDRFLRPATLYRASKFESYLNSAVSLSDRGIVSELTEKNLKVLENYKFGGESAK